MARNRMIKPEFWSSETLVKVSRDSRLLFIGIWNFCDDYGFCLNNTRQILGNVFPYDETVKDSNIKTWINELVKEKLLIPVDYNSKKLLFVKSWGQHQKVQHKSKRALIEEVDLERVIEDALESHESLVREYLDAHAPKRKKKEESNNKKSFKSWDRNQFWQEILNSKKDEYSNEMLESFFRWWVEPDSNDVMKFKKQDTWSTNGRLITWFKRSNN